VDIALDGIFYLAAAVDVIDITKDYAF
jgi:hypothetical protein